MLAPTIIKQKLSVGNISKSESATFWYIPIQIKANIVWNLLVSSIEDVKAIILRSGDTILGRWLFPKAIVAGTMQEVSPKRHPEGTGK